MRSKFIVALCTFVAINFFAAWAYLDKLVDGDLEAENREVLETYRRSDALDVLMLGSSLVARPYSDSAPKIPGVRIGSLASWSAMISDQYVLIHEVIKRVPTLIVLGVGPRDFADTRWIHPDQTLIFRTHTSISNINQFWFLMSGGVDNKLEFFANHCFPLYRNRRKFQKFVAESVAPLSHGSVPVSLQLADDKTIDLQFLCFEKLLKLAKSKGAKVLVVNMPISSAALSSLPASFYTTYHERLLSTCRQCGVEFADSNLMCFEHSDFLDVMHLNANGAEKWDSFLERKIEPLLGVN